MAELLAHTIRAALREAANPADAPAMVAYMKGVQPFLGVKTPARREIVRAALKGYPDRTERFAAAAELWQGEYREERYMALDLLAKSRLTVADLPVLESMLPACNWWDLLDTLMGLIGRVLTPHPELRREKVRLWRQSDHLWTRRAAILAQLHAKSQTDTALLSETIAALKHEKEFFIQKAIGWALREYAKTDADWVRQSVNELGLSGLARREALKHVGEDFERRRGRL